MTSLSDTLTVGLVLVLLFGSIALYLYTRIQQAEQKISLLESILLDLKMSAEIKSYSELPADQEHDMPRSHLSTDQAAGNYAPFSEDNDETDDADDYYPGAVVGETNQPKSGSPTPSVSGSLNDSADNEVTQYKSAIASAVSEDKPAENDVSTKVSVNYESMSLKELQALGKTRGITGAGSMKKSAIIEALKTSDRSSGAIQPGSTATSAFLDTSGPFQGSSVAEESQ
jgi:hypothetical protein